MKNINAVSNSSQAIRLKMKLMILLTAYSCFVAGQKQIPLYPGVPPGSESWNWQEKEFFVKVPLNANVIYNISKPSLTVFAPETANGCSVIICPGGGSRVLNYETEGIRYVKTLTQKGITVFILKYRLVQSLTEDPWAEMMKALTNPDSNSLKKLTAITELAKADLNVAIRYVKEHAHELKIDSNRIGLLGFSGGGQMVARVAYNFTAATKPAFVAPIYCVINRIIERVVKPDAPPLFIAAATDDQLAPVSNSINLYNDWMNAKRPVELHIYSTGGHGLRGSSSSQNWIHRFTEWLDSQNLLKSKL